MTVSKLGRTVIGAALTMLLTGATLTPAMAATGPVITWAGAITDGASYSYGLVAAVDTCTAVDETATAIPCTVSGYETTVGSHTLTATATANAATTTASISYTVTAWTLKGFAAPVKKAAGAVTTVKGGSVVPLKFRIYQDATKLKTAAAVSSITSQLVSCTDLSSSADPVSITSAQRGFSLKYRNGYFRQNWKTAKTVKVITTVTKVTHKGKKVIVKKVKTTVPACYLVTMTAADGSALKALFKLR
jgi:large repetitive protein